jgi:hypothetical protein
MALFQWNTFNVPCCRLMFRTVLTLMGFAISANSQYGIARNNYYPSKFTGSTFKGAVTESTEDHITLTYTKNDKVQKFNGRFETGCAVPSVSQTKMMPNDIPKGTVRTAFFNGETTKVDGQKVKENMILAIAFDEWKGQKVQEEKKKIYFCTNDKQFQFRAW